MDKPRLYIENSIYSKIMHFVNATDHEVGGMGLISYNKQENYFYLREAFLLEQEVSSVTTDLDAAAMGKLELEVMGREGDLNFWWHSHVNMGVFWSGTDTETIKKYGGNGYMVATVFNKKREMRSAIAYKASSSFGDSLVFIDELETIIYDSRLNIAELVEEFKTKVRKKVSPIQETIYNNSRWSGFNKKYDVNLHDHVSTKKALKELRKAMQHRTINSNLYAVIENNMNFYIEQGHPRAIAYEAAILGVSPDVYLQVSESLTQDDQQKVIKLIEEYEYFNGGYNDYFG